MLSVRNPGQKFPVAVTLTGFKDIGKLFNGNSLLNYSPGPLGWRHIDVLVSTGS
jgi:hypothetical protein